jgi:hypothetical protein
MLLTMKTCSFGGRMSLFHYGLQRILSRGDKYARITKNLIGYLLGTLFALITFCQNLRWSVGIARQRRPAPTARRDRLRM